MSSTPLSTTLPNTEKPRDRSQQTRPTLFLVFECDRVAARGARYGLADAKKVRILRGEGRSVERGATLDIAIPDDWLSREHATIEHAMNQWIVRDVGSRNGTFVNGARVEHAPLADGDVVEVGHTMMVFRHAQPIAADLDAETHAFSDPGLATMVPELAEQLDRAAAIAQSPIDVLVCGESGTGKELVARAFHQLSGRSGQLVAVNCGALVGTLVESELFGHKKGAFTGAAADRVGYVAAADRGTLFLDEVADLPLPSQAALLRVLQERQVVPVGSTQSVPVDVRVVSATHKAIDQMIADGTFRADLSARINGYRLNLPPLRERREDMGLLLAATWPDPALRLSVEAARALLCHSWPLNIRELHQALAVAAVLGKDGRIELDHLPESTRGSAPTAAALPEDDALRRQQLVELFREHNGNISAVARAMGKARTQIQRWVKRYGIDPLRFRS